VTHGAEAAVDRYRGDLVAEALDIRNRLAAGRTRGRQLRGRPPRLHQQFVGRQGPNRTSRL